MVKYRNDRVNVPDSRVKCLGKFEAFYAFGTFMMAGKGICLSFW